jgi:hypothetical protein|tara:strand:- start:921 stop:1148 length:228 start_codon:yes stop_codon:yes gene_type:complete
MSINWNHPDNSFAVSHLGVHSPSCFNSNAPDTARKLRIKAGYEKNLPKDLFDEDSNKTWKMKCVENNKSKYGWRT